MSAPSVLGLWLWALIVGFGAHYLCRKYPWTAIFVVPFSLLLPVLSFLADSAPLGSSAGAYAYHAGAVLIVVLAAAGLGMVQGGFKPWSLHAIELARLHVREARKAETPTPSEDKTPSSST